MRPRAGALLLLSLACGAAAPFSLTELMGMLAAVPAVHATFQEDRTVAQLTTPVHDSGTLDYIRPGRLEKHTLVPHDERLAVDGEKLWIVRPGQATRALDLDDQPEIAALVDAVRGTLSGDLAALRRHYAVALTGDREAWEMTLEPSDARVGRFLRMVRIEGSGADIKVVETVQANGDSSRMMTGP